VKVPENNQDENINDDVERANEQEAADKNNPFETLRSAVSNLRHSVEKYDANDPVFVAKLSWNNGKNQNQIDLIGCLDRQCTFQLKIGEEIFLVRVTGTSLNIDKINTGLAIFKGDSYSQSDRLAVDNISIPIISESDGNSYDLDAQAELRSPNGIQDLEYLTDYWFPKNKLTNDESCTIKLDNQKLTGAALEVNATFSSYWPEYDRKSRRWTVPVPNLENRKEWAALFVCVAVRRLIIAIANEPKKYGLSDNDFLKASSLVPTRPINLETSQVKQILAKNKARPLVFPWHVIETACSSLNAGKHVIFTGPPGCGKTRLAKALANLAGIPDPVIATASPSWTTDELIGRYMPDFESEKSKGLRFFPGLFLQAVADDKWLIIDELNRADIDGCFGELFTVISGEAAILPFQELVEDELRQIVILPESFVEDSDSDYEGYRKYPVGAKFRIIGTMNDADASRLSQLSYAFQRRFNIIRVEAPDYESVSGLLEQHIDEKAKKIRESNIRGFYTQLENRVNTDALPVLQQLFANKQTDLLRSRIVGVAQALDVIDFMLEAISGPRGNNLQIRWEEMPFIQITLQCCLQLFRPILRWE
jgi:MoxR-like ATPase